MYYIFADSGEFICDYETIEEALGRQSRMPEPTLVLYSTSPNCEDAWEHGIEVLAPDGLDHFFEYEIKFENGSVIQQRQKTLEACIEDIKYRLDHNPGAKLWGEIEEISRITHKVKL